MATAAAFNKPVRRHRAALALSILAVRGVAAVEPKNLQLVVDADGGWHASTTLSTSAHGGKKSMRVESDAVESGSAAQQITHENGVQHKSALTA